MNGHRMILLLTLLLCFLRLPAPCSSEQDKNETLLLDEDEIAIKRWQETFKRVKKIIGTGIKMVMPYFMTNMDDKDLHLSQQCRRALFQWIADIKAMKPWALKMGDASAKVIDGILSGTLSTYGSFDQCLDTVNPKGHIQGKYCSVEIWPHLPPKPRFYSINERLKAFKRYENDTGPMGEFTKSLQLFYMFPIKLGVCIPSPCSKEDISNISSLVSKRYFSLNVTVPHCEIREPTVIEPHQIPVFFAFGMLILLVVIGTMYDVLIVKKQNPDSSKEMGIFSDCLMSFSALENWNKLMDLEAGADDLSVLHGIRFFSMCWIILGHTYFHLNFNILRHLQVTIELTSRFIFSFITNATLLVDNFFFFSGLLLTYVTMDMMKVIGKVPRYIFFVIHRLWRFVPIQLFFIGCSMLLPLLGDGPTWHENIDPIVEGCKKDWWVNLIFINNVYRPNQGCLSYSWYLAADFQLYVLCIPLAVLVIRKPRIGLWVNFVLIILSMIGIGVHNYIRELPPTLLFTRADVGQRNALMKETYYTPFYHIGPSCIGILVGYFLQVHKGRIEMHWALHVGAWLGAFAFTFGTLFGVYPWNKGHGATGPIPTLLYASLSRVGWTLGIAWVTIACTKGCGGILAKILRYKVFIPLSRLTFLVYMVHPLIQFVFYGTLRNGIQALNQLAVFICFGFIVASYGLAFILSIFLESPFINLGKVIFRRREAGKRKNRRSSLAHNGEISNLPDKTPSDWRSEQMSELAVRNGKCNGAYDFRTDDVESGPSRMSSKQNGRENGDLVCRL